jgi:hypothetical protein
MTIENEVKTRKIKFTRIESVKEHFPTHRVQIGIETENIKTDFNNHIWLSDTDIEKFLIGLDLLDRSRKGEATLESLSPGQMTLAFKSIDNLGHLSVSLRFVKDDRLNRDYSFDIKVEFQIDPTSLTTVRNGSIKLME